MAILSVERLPTVLGVRWNVSILMPVSIASTTLTNYTSEDFIDAASGNLLPPDLRMCRIRVINQSPFGVIVYTTGSNIITALGSSLGIVGQGTGAFDVYALGGSRGIRSVGMLPSPPAHNGVLGDRTILGTAHLSVEFLP